MRKALRAVFVFSLAGAVMTGSLGLAMVFQPPDSLELWSIWQTWLLRILSACAVLMWAAGLALLKGDGYNAPARKVEGHR
jgi:hypothetical protein